MEQKLQRNIRLYGIFRVFTKRVFLPITTIYLADIAGLSIRQIGLLATLSAVVSLVSDVPTGYFADRVGRKTSLTVFCSIAIFASLVYALFPSFYGAAIAVFFESLAYSFLSGSSEALMHDTLYALKRTNDYPKIVGRAQSIGLVGNTALVAAIPFTYDINPRFPFFLGAVAFALLLIIVRLFHEPERVVSAITHSYAKDLLNSLRFFVTRKTVIMFLAIGILTGFSYASSDFINLSLKELGLNVKYIGLAYALGSILGIVGGFYIHLLRKVSLRTYAFVDLLVTLCVLLAIGVGRNLWIAIPAFALGMGFFRLRNIMYQYHLLLTFKDSKYKATLISVLSMFGRACEVWVPMLFILNIHAFGLFGGMAAMAAIIFTLVTPLAIVGSYQLKKLRIS